MSVNTSYLLVGNGRLATHLDRYFKFNNINFDTWHRSSSTSFANKVEQRNIILLAINDDAIDSFINQHKDILQNKILIHFSGALFTDKAYGYHPLMTFSNKSYSDDDYRKILFVQDDDAPEFNMLFPKLQNPFIKIPKDYKAKYHALCVMANNYTCLLWQKFFSELEAFNVNAELLAPFLKQTTQNIADDYRNCLTGPLCRGDMRTVEKNIESLKGDSYQEIYKSFVKMFTLKETDENHRI